MIPLASTATCLALLLLLPALTFALECLASLRAPTPVPAAPPPSFVVVVPAHDEAPMIGDCVRALIADLPAEGSVLVVADNCTDETASLAAAAGAAVLQRTEPNRVGKGYALLAARGHLRAAPPQVVVVVDADGRFVRGGAADLAAAGIARPVQCVYFIGDDEPEDPVRELAAFAVAIRNRVRPRGLAALGSGVNLSGSGFALPWSAWLLVDPPAGSIVEDLEMGLALALQRQPVRLLDDVHIRSAGAPSRIAARVQRLRWEGGRLHVALVWLPRLLRAMVVQRRLDLLGLFLDLLVPPVALLVLMQGLVAAGSVVLWLRGGPAAPLVIAASGLAAIAAGLVSGSRLAPLRRGPLWVMRTAGRYLLWKLSLYVGLARRGRPRAWVRTPRAAPRPPEARPDPSDLPGEGDS